MSIIAGIFEGTKIVGSLAAKDDLSPELESSKTIDLLKLIPLNSIAFEDSIQGLRSSLAAKIPTIYIPSNIPACIDKNIDLNCFIDTLGNDSCKANVIKGPKLDSNYVDCGYLEKYLLTL